MPLARQAASQPHPPRRAVAMGSHQIVFSSPIQRAEKDNNNAITTVQGQPRKTRPASPPPQPVQGELSISGHAHITRSSIPSSGPALAPLSHTTVPPPPPAQQTVTTFTKGTSMSTASRPTPSWPASSSSAATALSRPHIASQPVMDSSVSSADRASPMPTRSMAGSNAMRVSKLLRDARAAVNAPFRPETPLDLLPVRDRNTSHASRHALRPHITTNSNSVGMRHAPERPARLPIRPQRSGNAEDMTSLREAEMEGTTDSMRTSLLLSSSSDTALNDSQGFLVALTESAGSDTTRQVALLHALRRWLSNPCHTPSLALLQYLTSHVAHAARAASANASTQVEDTSSEATMHVGVAMAAVLLHHSCSSSSTAMAESCPGAMDIVCLLRHTVACGLGRLLEKELVFEPVLHLLTLAPAWTTTHAQLVQSVLDLLIMCTQSNNSSKTRGSSATSATVEIAASPVSASTSHWTAQLVTLGLIPALNRVMEQYLLHSKQHDTNASKSYCNDVLVNHESELAALRTSALCEVCELYRRLAPHYAHHLCKLGTLPYFTEVLQSEADNGQVVQAVSRVLAKLVFDTDCLTVLQRDEHLLPSVMTALQCQLAKEAQKDTSEALLVSRLCAVAARLTEGCARNRQYLTTKATPVLQELVQRFVIPLPSTTATATSINEGEEDITNNKNDDEDGEDGTMTLIQHVVWLVGAAAVSEQCGLDFVRAVLPPLLAFLHVLDFTPRTRLTAIYSLMCLSNLSYYFADLEREEEEEEKPKEVQERSTEVHTPMLASLYETLGLIVAGFLFEGDAEAAVEATRILGNVSFTNCGRDWLELNRCDEVALLFCGHEDLRIVYNCFGIVLNLTAATQCRLVSDPELLSMLLRYTGRFTRQEALDEAAAKAKPHLTDLFSTESKEDADQCDKACEVASDYAEQIADLVEKVLLNVHGLLHPAV